MPPVLVAIGGLATAISTASAATLMTVAGIALTIGTTVFGAVQQRAAAKKAKRRAAQAREDFLNSLQERTVTRIATYAPYRYVYGRARVGSDVVAVLSSGTNEEYKHIICVHAAHECDGIEEVYIEGKPLGALDAEGFVTSGEYYSVATENATEHYTSSPFTLAHNPTSAITVIAYGRAYLPNGVFYRNHSAGVAYTRSGNTITITGRLTSPLPGGSVTTDGYRVTYQYQKNTSQVRVIKHLGAPGDPADATLLAECGDKWKSTATLTGLCYTVIRLDLRQSAFQGGLPSIEVLVRGKKLYDPRTGVTAWSDNPALVIYDYLTSEMCGVSAADLPVAYYITAANVCDESRSFGKLYTCNGTVTADEDQAGILDGLAASMAGGIVAMTWEIYAGKYVAPIASLDQSDIVGSLAVTPGISDADIINGVRGQFVSSENEYVATDFSPYQNAVYLAADGKEKWADITYPYTDSTRRVHNLARIEAENQRNAFTVKADFSLKAWDLHIGDRITLTSAFLGQTDKVYRITDKSYAPDTAITLTLKEDVAEIWDEADAVTVDATPNTDLPNPFAIPPLSFVTLDSGTDALLIQQDGTIVSRIRVTWDTPRADIVSQGLIEIEWQKQTDTAWRKTTATGSETETHLAPVDDGVWYTVRARAVNPYLNVRSDWKYSDLHQVLGKSAPPSDIADLSIDGATLSWTPVSDLDLAGYVFRYHFGTNLDWGTAVPLHSGIITSSPYTLTTLPFGTVTIMGKALDTSGNESVNVITIFTNLGDAPVANVVETHSLDPTFPGTLTGCTIKNGAVEANAADSFYGDDAQSFYGADSTSFYKPAAGFGQLVYTSDEVTLTTVLPGSKLTLDLVTEGIDVKVEYRMSGAGSFYGLDDDPFYGPDGSPTELAGPEAFDSIESTGFIATDINKFYSADVTNFDPSDPNSFYSVDLQTFSNLELDSFYGVTGGVWATWPGQINAKSASYQFRITIGSNVTPGRITKFGLVVDAPDITEVISDLPIGATPTAIPYTKTFTAIKVVNATLQANSSGAITVEIDKTNPVAPTILAYNSAHTAVSGATADIFLQGY